MATESWSGLARPGAITRLCQYLSFLLLISTGYQSFAQSYFYSENKLATKLSRTLYYFIFLTIEPDGSATARIRYSDPSSGQDHLVEQNFADSTGQMNNYPDSNLRYLYSHEQPVFLVGDEDTSYIVPRFVFQREGDSSSSFYTLRSVEHPVGDGSWDSAGMVVLQQKSFGDLTREQELVSRFYGKEEAFYKYLYTPDTRALNKIDRNARLWVIAVANTNDPKIGVTTKKDLAKITGTLTDLQVRLGIRIVMQEIAGDQFGKAAVEAALNRVRPAPIDIVVFYFSGHGFRYPGDTSKYPRISLRGKPELDLDQNNVPLENIYKRLLKKAARVTIVMSDCCNENIDAPQPVGADMIRVRSTLDAKLNIDHCKALFFPDHPIAVLTTAAEKNQLAVGNPLLGGFFTNFVQAELLKSLYGNDGTTLWGVILRNAKDKTARQALTAPCNNARCIQRAEISVMPPL